MNLVLIFTIMLGIISGVLLLPTPSFGQQSPLQNHPLTPITAPITIGNGTVFRAVVIFNTQPVQDVGLGEYNKAVNFENVKTTILNATFSDKMLKDVASDVEKQRSDLLTEGNNIQRYYTNGSTTLQYSNWWMQSYVLSRLDEDCLRTISSNMIPGMNLKTAIDPIDKEMQRIISNYSLNYTKPLQQPTKHNMINSTASNLTKTLLPPNSHQVIVNMTKNITSVKEVGNNSTLVANASKVTPSIPEFGPLVRMMVVMSVIGAVIISRISNT